MTQSPLEKIDYQQLAQSARQTGLEEFKNLLASLPVAAYTCDPLGLITYYNQRAVELWGRAPRVNDPVDRYCGSFLLFSSDGDPILHTQCWMAMALRCGKGFNGRQVFVQRPNGQRLAVLAYANPIHDESGQLVGAVNVLVDISDRQADERRVPLAPVVVALTNIETDPSLPPHLKEDVAKVRRNLEQDAQAPAPAAQRDNSARPRILVVEDDLDTAQMMARLLKSAGYDVETALSAASALQLVGDKSFDILISDIGLPDATGYDLMMQIKERYNIKGIALSGYDSDEDVNRSLAVGFSEHVVKPVNFAQLRAAIERIKRV